MKGSLLPISEATDEDVFDCLEEMLRDLRRTWKEAESESKAKIEKMTERDMELVIAPIWSGAKIKIDGMDYVLSHLLRRVELCKVRGVLDGDPRVRSILTSEY